MTKKEFIQSYGSGGYTNIPSALFRLNISSSDFKLLAYIASWDNPDSVNYPKRLSIGYIKTNINMAESTIRESRTKLLQDDYLSQFKSGNSYYYTVNWSKIKELVNEM